MYLTAKLKSLANPLKNGDAKPYGSKGAFGRLRQPVAIESITPKYNANALLCPLVTVSMGICPFLGTF